MLVFYASISVFLNVVLQGMPVGVLHAVYSAIPVVNGRCGASCQASRVAGSNPGVATVVGIG